MRLRLTLRRLSCAALACALALPAGAAPAGKCLAGDCVNGRGTFQLRTGTLLTGDWVGGSFRPGRFDVKYAFQPEREYDVELDSEGLPVRGTILRAGNALHAPTKFTGTFERFQHPFDKVRVARFAQGRFVDAGGRVYEGTFEFVPRPFGGHYVMQGVRIDQEADEVRSGLFVSEWTNPESIPGSSGGLLDKIVSFQRATPDYLVTLQAEIREQVARINADEAERLAQERESRESWKSFLSAAIGVAAVIGVARYASKGSGGSAASSVGATLRGRQSSAQGMNQLVANLRDEAKSDPALAGRIGQASDTEVAAMLRQAGSHSSTTTVAEYRKAKGEGELTNTALTPAVRSAPVAAAPDAPTGRQYPLQRNFTYPTLGFSEQEACAEANRKVEAHLANGTLKTVISRGSCSCTKERMTVGGAAYLCKIPVTDQVMVNYDPSVGPSTKSK